MTYQKPLKVAAILAILIFSVVILVHSKPFLVPVCFAGLLSMLLLPEVRWLQKKGIGKALAALISIFTLVAAGALIIFLIGWQMQDVIGNASDIEEKVAGKIQQAQQFISDKLHIPGEEQKRMIEKQQSSSSGKLSGAVMGFLAGLAGLFTKGVLVLVYIFLFIYFRSRIKGFILKLVPDNERRNASTTIGKAQQVAQKYLSSLGLMIVILWVMYGIGFSIIGVKQPLFFAVLCGLLEIVPFVGNLAGTALTVIVSMAQGGSGNVLIGILITYAVVQFVQTYLLEPLVVGKGVRINPLFTIAGLVAGELVWGIPGMILAIPLLGMAKIICEHVEPLKPYAYLMGND